MKNKIKNNGMPKLSYTSMKFSPELNFKENSALELKNTIGYFERKVFSSLIYAWRLEEGEIRKGVLLANNIYFDPRTNFSSIRFIVNNYAKHFKIFLNRTSYIRIETGQTKPNSENVKKFKSLLNYPDYYTPNSQRSFDKITNKYFTKVKSHETFYPDMFMDTLFLGSLLSEVSLNLKTLTLNNVGSGILKIKAKEKDKIILQIENIVHSAELILERCHSSVCLLPIRSNQRFKERKKTTEKAFDSLGVINETHGISFKESKELREFHDQTDDNTESIKSIEIPDIAIGNRHLTYHIFIEHLKTRPKSYFKNNLRTDESLLFILTTMLYWLSQLGRYYLSKLEGDEFSYNFTMRRFRKLYLNILMFRKNFSTYLSPKTNDFIYAIEQSRLFDKNNIDDTLIDLLLNIIPNVKNSLEKLGISEEQSGFIFSKFFRLQDVNCIESI